MKGKNENLIVDKSLQKNRKAWVRIVEAFVAVLLIAGVVLMFANQEYLRKKSVSAEIYEIEASILRDIQLDNALRREVLSAPIGEVGSGLINNRINELKPIYLECKAKICETSDACVLDNPESKDVYAQSAIITSTLEEYKPRQIKLFCW